MRNTRTVGRAAVIFSMILVVALIGGTFAAYAGTGAGGSKAGDNCSNVGIEDTAPFPAAPNGQLACGAFRICEGSFFVNPADIPNCKGTNLTVWCMNDQGQWVNNTVHDVMWSEGMLWFTVDQRGECAVFQAGSGLQSGVIAGQ